MLLCYAGAAVLLLPLGGNEVAWSGRSGIMTRHAGILRYARVDGMVGADGTRTEWHVDWLRLGVTLALVRGCCGVGIAAGRWAWREPNKQAGAAPHPGSPRTAGVPAPLRVGSQPTPPSAQAP